MEAYLQAYAAHAGLAEHTLFGTQVLSVEDHGEGESWTVTYRKLEEPGSKFTKEFDAVVVCNGAG